MQSSDLWTNKLKNNNSIYSMDMLRIISESCYNINYSLLTPQRLRLKTLRE